MSDSDSVHAVLNPPALARFRELTGIGDARLDVRFDGWWKLAVLTEDRVFLFPRRGADARLLRGAEACEALASLGVAIVPKVLGRWFELDAEVGPFVAFERRHGRQWAQVEDQANLEEVHTLMRSLGAAVAEWHNVEPEELPASVRAPLHADSRLDSFLDLTAMPAAALDLAEAIGVPESTAGLWTETIAPVSAMATVFTHGDVCEGQLLVDEEGRVTAVLDWDTAGMGHPLRDFDFGEWGFGIYPWERDFLDLRRELWRSYVASREVDQLPSAESVHLTFTLSELAYFTARDRRGDLDAWGTERLALCREAEKAATAALEIH